VTYPIPVLHFIIEEAISYFDPILLTNNMAEKAKGCILTATYS
jgi:hypothetical protein